MREQIIFGLLLSVPVLVLIYLVFAPKVRRIRRARIRTEATVENLETILNRNVRLYSYLPADLKEQLLGHVNVFLAEKEFIGCDGQEITDEVRFTVAGTACMLLLNREPSYFPGFTSILVYPESYRATSVHRDGHVEVREDSVRAGESWYRGPIVLSWKDVMRGVTNPEDGSNVVLHEFAHKLDEENKSVDGLPPLHESGHYKEWAEVLGREYKALEKRVARHKNRVLDEYGLTSPPEFFAVATESFFEKPRSMRKRLPDLYEQLERYYRVDPASWREPAKK